MSFMTNLRASFWPAPDPEPTLASWRGSLTAYTLRVLLVSIAALQGLVFISYWPEPIPLTTLWPSAVFPVTLVALAFARTTRARAAVILMGFVCVAPLLFAAFGPSPTGFLPLLTACTLAAVLIGPRAAIAFIVASKLAILLGAIAHEQGTFLSPAAPGSHITTLIWFRMGLVWFACTSWVVFVTSWLSARFEQALERKDRALEEARLASQRTVASEQRRQDTESALIEAQKHEALGRLAGGVSHDFNNALFVILGWNDLLQRDEVAPAQRPQAHQAIATAARNAAELAKRIMSMSRERPGAAHQTRLQPVVSEAVRVLGRLLPDDIRITSELHDVPPVAIDGGQLQQVLYNLALHARDAMPEGGRLGIRLTSESDSGGRPWVVLRLQDTSTGQDTESDRADVGLTATRAILERAESRLEREVVPGRGGEWCVRIPIAVERSPDRRSASRPVRTARILVVEDDTAVRELLVAALSASGHRVVAAPDGDVAMELLADPGAQHDLLCIDGILPGAPSTAIIDRFRVVCPGRPVLVCSGHLASPQLQVLVQEERLPFLPKPFTPDQLLHRIDQLIGEDRQPLVR